MAGSTKNDDASDAIVKAVSKAVQDLFDDFPASDESTPALSGRFSKLEKRFYELESHFERLGEQFESLS